MEAWITEENQCSSLELLENNGERSPTLSSHIETNLCSESVDSGVETASSDMSFHATSSSASTDNAETDRFTPEREDEGFTQALESPILSCPTPSSSFSSSPHLCPSRAKEDSIALHQKVEQALTRTNSKYLKDRPEPLTAHEELRRQPRASFLPKRHASEVVRTHRTERFDLRTMVNPLAPVSDKQPCQRKLEVRRCFELSI